MQSAGFLLLTHFPFLMNFAANLVYSTVLQLVMQFSLPTLVMYMAVTSLGEFLETSKAPVIVYSTAQLASYSLGATGSELSL